MCVLLITGLLAENGRYKVSRESSSALQSPVVLPVSRFGPSTFIPSMLSICARPPTYWPASHPDICRTLSAEHPSALIALLFDSGRSFRAGAETRHIVARTVSRILTRAPRTLPRSCQGEGTQTSGDPAPTTHAVKIRTGAGKQRYMIVTSIRLFVITCALTAMSFRSFALLSYQQQTHPRSVADHL
jgi:hypothetical protein